MEQHNNLKTSLIAGALFIFFILIASAYIPSFLIINKSIIDIIAPGRSISKLFLSETYLLLLFIVSLIVLFFNNEHKKSSETKRISSRLKYIFFGTFLFAYTLNVISFLWFIAKYHFNVTDFVISFKNGALSSTQFIHNHVFKGIFGIFVQFFHKGPATNIDTGTAFIGVFPAWFFLLGTFLFVLAVVLSFVIFYQKLIEQPRSAVSVICFILLYNFSTFILLKNIADGGFFDRSTLPAFCILIMLLYGTSKRLLYFLGISIVMYVGIVASILFSRAGGFGNIKYYLLGSIVVGWLLYFPLYVFKTKKITRLIVLLFVLDLLIIIYMSYVGIYGINGPVNYLNQNIGSDGAVVASFMPISRLHYTELPSINKLHFYIYQNKKSSTTVGEIIHSDKLLYTYFPVSVPWQSCIPFSNTLRFVFDLKSTLPFTAANQTWIKISSSELISHADGLYSYHIVMLLNACMPQQLDVISQYFYGRGLNTFFIYNISQGEYEFNTD